MPFKLLLLPARLCPVVFGLIVNCLDWAEAAAAADTRDVALVLGLIVPCCMGTY